jgi:nucleotide-binding universal stress UspA family protein
MQILICSDGTDPADKPIRLAGLLARPCQAETTLLGIAERAGDEQPLGAALESEAEKLRALGVSPQLVIRTGEPIHEIQRQMSAAEYDLVIIGTRRKGTAGLYWRSEKTYGVIRAIPAPVLLATGACESLKSFVVCTGGKNFIDAAIQLTGKVAACVGASVTLLHVMAEPPAIYADLVRLEEDVDQLLQSGSELGRNLLAQKENLERLGVAVRVRLRHGLVLHQVFAEVEEAQHDLIVTGSTRARGPLGHYIMGDLTQGIVNRADVPVLVARTEKSNAATRTTFWSLLKDIFGSTTDPVPEPRKTA